MTRIDWLLTRRMASRIIGVVVIFFGLIVLIESMDGWRFDYLAENQGRAFAFLAIFTAAASWSIKVLPVTVLLGAIIALIELQRSRELMVIKASGFSIWRILRGPVVFIVLGSIFVSLVVDAQVTELSRGIEKVPRLTDNNIGGPNNVWLEQDSTDGRIVIQATRTGREAHILDDATFFLPRGREIRRIEADHATLTQGEWQLESALLLASNQFPRFVPEYTVDTTSTRAELELRLTTGDDFTFFELQQALASGLADPVAQAAAAMRFAKLMALPGLLVGSLLIAFAFTAGYRRTGSYGGTILYGIVLGFVVFVITEMADRAGSAGVLDPTFAAWGPAIVAIVIGVTVLLYKEDGRA